MHHIVVTHSDYDFDANHWLTETLCSFDVGPEGIERVFEGADQIPSRVAVLDIENGQSVTLESDPERWAELLPSAFRSGDLAVHVDVATAEVATAEVETGPEQDIRLVGASKAISLGELFAPSAQGASAPAPSSQAPPAVA